MILAEDGLLSINDPVEKFLPAFANLQIREKKEGEDLEEVRKPKRKITIRDLLTHTSGMGSGLLFRSAVGVAGGVDSGFDHVGDAAGRFFAQRHPLRF